MENYSRVLTLEQGKKLNEYLVSINELPESEIFSETNNYGIDITPELGYEFVINVEYNYEKDGKDFLSYSFYIKHNVNESGGFYDYVHSFLDSVDKINDLVSFVKSIE